MTILLHARLDNPRVKNKITTSLFVLTWSSLTLRCSIMLATGEGKEKKNNTRQTRDNYIMLVTLAWRGRRYALVIAPEARFRPPNNIAHTV
jgi:hypothetical protein